MSVQSMLNGPDQLAMERDAVRRFARPKDQAAVELFERAAGLARRLT